MRHGYVRYTWHMTALYTRRSLSAMLIESAVMVVVTSTAAGAADRGTRPPNSIRTQIYRQRSFYVAH